MSRLQRRGPQTFRFNSRWKWYKYLRGSYWSAKVPDAEGSLPATES
jgi:hypothetical protein